MGRNPYQFEAQVIAALREARDNGVSAVALGDVVRNMDLDLIEKALRSADPEAAQPLAPDVDRLIVAIEQQGVAVLATRPIAEIADSNEIDEDTVREHLPRIREAIANSSAPEVFDTVCFNVLVRTDEASPTL